MEYTMEELLPIVEKLTGKYTSFESSSITYETARMLMGAVLYCIEEFYNTGSTGLTVAEKLDASIAYQRGYDLVISKVYASKEIYEDILGTFNDFQCRNCKDTITKGLPQFFLKYDPKFNPQDHILTLDYPTVRPVHAFCGINVIYEYLCNIQTEWIFLNAFDTKRIELLLERIMTDYQNLFLDNISYSVLLSCLGCIIAEKPIAMLELQADDMETIAHYFKHDTVEKAELKIEMLLSKLFDNVYTERTALKDYFAPLSKDYAIRIVNGLNHHSLKGIFYITDTL
ncbi:hypothetical protein acsn021_19480 [Anaerocolumna cellulosilytica]|uniref:Uncharacterized protein n=1 Tax=Anaerocolumna cellulosilytica TaxID=433286 RepID=A0A6S6QZ89_9FIRM|nr:DUF6179 domain-containing protein [Anaerocolumna cellulosilytica]MBB5194659.1 hypothetical protein [Anaerocolumna cellulosilytica]BCJ94379.1 hypothetical protein acsn021_19480 [Anaerocolumna cellulosilytica]